MSIAIVRFRPEHLQALALQAQQIGMREVVDRPEYGAALALSGQSFTVLAGGQVVACIGVHEIHPQRVEAWALLADAAGPHLRAITRAVAGWLAVCPYRRVEANVATGFRAGHRWATLLGFKPEGPPRPAFFPDGSSAVTYTRIHDGSLPTDDRDRVERCAGDRGDPQRQHPGERREGERGGARHPG